MTNTRPTYRDAAGITYTLEDLTVTDDPIATPADARRIDEMPIGGTYTIDLGALGLLNLERVS